MQAPGPILETERLILRPTAREDFESIVEFMGDPRSAEHVGGVQPRANVWRGMMAMAGAWALDGYAMFSVIEKSSGHWIGRIGPWHPEGWPGTEVGWGLRVDAWGKGYAFEAAVATIDWAFDTLGWDDVIHTIVPQNLPSKRLAERLGSSHRGMGRLPPPFDLMEVEIWGQTREQWRAWRTRHGTD